MLKHAAVAALTLMMVTFTTPAPEAPQQRRALSGDLTKAIDQYTGDEFAALVGGMSFTGGQQRARRCRGNPACAQNRRTNVRVDEATDADSLSPGTIPQFGVVTVRAIVRGPDADARYGMQSTGPDGRFAYFVIVTRGATAGTMRWRLEELSVQGNVRAHRMLAQGQVRECNHPYVRGARADFKTCADPVVSQASFTPLSALFQAGEPPMWFACSAGCCYIEDGSTA